MNTKDAIWRPYTQMKNLQELLPVVRAEGAFLELENGRKILDALSSWWVTLHGHSHPVIASAIYEQAKTLDHVIFAHCTHSPGEVLAEKLLNVLPNTLNHLLYSDNGSTAVEVAIKMAYQYFRNTEQAKRKKFVSFEGGYHGDTFGAMSITGPSLFTKPFEELLFQVERVPMPYTFIGDTEVEEKEEKSLASLEALFKSDPEGYVAVIIEPLVQGASGMRMMRTEFLQKLRACTKKYGVFLIFDEVMVGFGRTGSLFACTKSGVIPDIICLSKGITGGFLPLAVTCCTDVIYEAFLGDDHKKVLFHAHSYMANPIVCSAAIASLELLLATPEKYENVEEIHKEEIARFIDHPKIAMPRIMGTIAALDIVTKGQPEYVNSVNKRIQKHFLEQDILIRPLGNTVYFLLPYCAEKEDIQRCYKCLEDVLEII